MSFRRYLMLVGQICAAAIAASAHAGALSVSGASVGGAPAPAGPFAAYANGPTSDPSFFPIAVWWQAPSIAGHYGPYGTQAAAIAGEKMNIVLGIAAAHGAEEWWPEQFGRDEGELAVIKAAGLYLIGGISTPTTQNTSNDSVASVMALAQATGAQSTVIGYNVGDEPNCTLSATAPAAVAAIQSYDPTRIVTWNQVAWMLNPEWGGCTPARTAAMQAASVASFDIYPLTNAWLHKGAPSDFTSVANDDLYVQGLTTRAAVHFARQGQPVWAYIEAGGDNLHFAEMNPTFNGAVSAGSNILVNASGWSKFTATWVGLTVAGAGLPAGTTIVAVTDPLHAVLSAPSSVAAAKEPITVTGGVNGSDCVASVNLCVVNGNEYRPTASQVNAEVWMSVINGATGIEYFCHDKLTSAFCLGDVAGGPAAAATQANLTYIDTTLQSFAPVINASTAASCSTDTEVFTTGKALAGATCSNAILQMSSGDVSMTGAAMVKTYNGATYLFAQVSRRNRRGALFQFQLFGTAGKKATVVYDSNAHYDPANSNAGKSIRIRTNGFSDMFGLNGDDYQVKIYQIS